MCCGPVGRDLLADQVTTELFTLVRRAPDPDVVLLGVDLTQQYGGVELFNFGYLLADVTFSSDTLFVAFCPTENDATVNHLVETGAIQETVVDPSMGDLFPEWIEDYTCRHYLKKIPYTEYLQTEHWGSVRSKALERAEHRCQLCNADSALHVHHRTYERRGNERISDLTVLCKTCHERFHGVTNGRVTNRVT